MVLFSLYEKSYNWVADNCNSNYKAHTCPTYSKSCNGTSCKFNEMVFKVSFQFSTYEKSYNGPSHEAVLQLKLQHINFEKQKKKKKKKKNTSWLLLKQFTGVHSNSIFIFQCMKNHTLTIWYIRSAVLTKCMPKRWEIIQFGSSN